LASTPARGSKKTGKWEGDLKNPSILYWKWDDSHLESEKYLGEIEDIVNRSCFDSLYITTHWCHEGITSSKMQEAIRKACQTIHQKGRKMIFEIDFRAEKAVFVKQHPNQRMGFVYWIELDLDGKGVGETCFKIEQGEGGELFLGNHQSGESLLKVYSYRKTGNGYDPDTLRDITSDSGLSRKNKSCVTVEIASPSSLDRKAFVLAVSWFDFNDLFSKENDAFFTGLLEQYSTIPLDGIALDEMGYPWHIDFDFTPSTYMTWNNSPYFSWSMQKKYEEQYGRDLYLDYLNRFVGSAAGSKEQVKAINYYFEFVRLEIARVEELFYSQGKKLYGKGSFIGVHPTWYAIEETQNTPEIWKNGVDWWDVPRDYGFTDEIMIYPVRLALAHKAKSAVFYNMWYSEATLCLDTFITEIFRNARYGGRTISLGYECINEQGIVMQLKEPGMLEAVSEAEAAMELLDGFQTAPAASDILVIMGIPAACSLLSNKNGKGDWNSYQNRFKEAFEIAKGIWDSGYNCDLVASYEIDNKNVFVEESGRILYGNQSYRFVVMVNPEYCKQAMLTFIGQVRDSKKGMAIIGEMKSDFDGADVNRRFWDIAEGAHFYHEKPEISDLLFLFQKHRIDTNRIPNGSILQDGSAILTAPSPDKSRGNVFESTFTLEGHSIHIRANDLAAIKINQGGDIGKFVATGLLELSIDEDMRYRFELPQTIKIIP